MGILRRLFGEREPPRDLVPLIAPLCAPAAQLVKVASGEGRHSWFGGSPSVPAGFEWPRKEGTPLTFLAQLELRELAAAVDIEWLPKRGSLLFFYDLYRMPWGFDPKDAGGCRVVLVDEAAERASMDPPEELEPQLRIERRAVSFRAVELPPPAERAPVAALGLTDRELDAFGDLVDARFDGEPHHHVGGFPDPVQGDEMELESQLVTHGLFCGDPSGYEDPRAKELEPGAADWKLLLQLDSDEELGVMWGDLGRLYFWVREQDARAGRFDGVWLVLQCG